MGRSGGQPADLERDVADLLTVMDAVDAQRPYLAAAGIGGAIYAALAKENPERVAGLIWHGPFARSAWAPDYPWGGTPEELESYATKIAESWGTEPFAADFVAGGAPSRVGDVDATHFFAHWMRQTSDAWTAAEYNRRWDAIGLQPWLGEVRVPTLLTTRGIDPAEAAHVARLMPAATLVGLDGPDFMPFFDSGPFIHAVRDFMSRT
jgi:pimeloyl-ACP methyl ester carboxylesterase